MQEVRAPAAADLAESSAQPPVAGSLRLGRLRAVVAAVVLATVYLLLVLYASVPLANNDTFFHLRFGREFLTGAWSIRDPGSVTTLATADWVPTQWLPQVVMARTEDWFGLAGVAWLSGLLYLSLATAVYWACRRHAEPAVAAGLVVLTLVACTSGMSMRPQQLSYLFVVLTAAAWLRARETHRAPWLLVPLTLLWTTCHGMWPVGIVIGAVAVLGLALDRDQPRGTLPRMVAVPALSALVTLLSPAGPGLFPAVLSVSANAEYFYEWGPPVFTEVDTVALLVLLALALVPRLRGHGPVTWFDLGLLTLACLWAVYSLRTVPVAACLAAPLAAAAIQPGLGVSPRVRRAERALVLAGYVVALASLAVVVPRTADVPADRAPWMDAALGSLPPGTTLLAPQADGGYLMWRYPHLELVAHGYGDAFTHDELERNVDISQVRGGWVERLRETGAEHAVLPPGGALAYNLREVLGWEVVERSERFELLIAPPDWSRDRA